MELEEFIKKDMVMFLDEWAANPSNLASAPTTHEKAGVQDNSQNAVQNESALSSSSLPSSTTPSSLTTSSPTTAPSSTIPSPTSQPTTTEKELSKNPTTTEQPTPTKSPAAYCDDELFKKMTFLESSFYESLIDHDLPKAKKVLLELKKIFSELPKKSDDRPRVKKLLLTLYHRYKQVVSSDTALCLSTMDFVNDPEMIKITSNNTNINTNTGHSINHSNQSLITNDQSVSNQSISKGQELTGSIITGPTIKDEDDDSEEESIGQEELLTDLNKGTIFDRGDDERLAMVRKEIDDRLAMINKLRAEGKFLEAISEFRLLKEMPVLENLPSNIRTEYADILRKVHDEIIEEMNNNYDSLFNKGSLNPYFSKEFQKITERISLLINKKNLLRAVKEYRLLLRLVKAHKNLLSKEEKKKLVRIRQSLIKLKSELEKKNPATKQDTKQDTEQGAGQEVGQGAKQGAGQEAEQPLLESKIKEGEEFKKEFYKILESFYNHLRNGSPKEAIKDYKKAREELLNFKKATEEKNLLPGDDQRRNKIKTIIERLVADLKRAYQLLKSHLSIVNKEETIALLRKHGLNDQEEELLLNKQNELLGRP